MQHKKSFYSRFQTLNRRRLLGKTNYHKRIKLLTQDKNKHGQYKNRMVIRFTNSQVICQIVRTSLKGDIILASAYSSELKEYGLPVGLTNYSAAYITGLLVGLRLLNKFEIEAQINENVEQEHDVESNISCIVDIGVRRSTKGNRAYAAMKGCIDSGIEVPHSDKNFYGEDTEQFKDRLLGQYIVAYMEKLKTEDPESYKSKFSKYIEAGLVGEKYTNAVLATIQGVRDNCEKKTKEAKDYSGFKKYQVKKMNKEQKMSKIKERLESTN